MRKGQEKLIARAKKYGFTENAIKILSDETLTLNKLNDYFVILCHFLSIQDEIVPQINQILNDYMTVEQYSLAHTLYELKNIDYIDVHRFASKVKENEITKELAFYIMQILGAKDKENQSVFTEAEAADLAAYLMEHKQYPVAALFSKRFEYKDSSISYLKELLQLYHDLDMGSEKMAKLASYGLTVEEIKQGKDYPDACFRNFDKAYPGLRDALGINEVKTFVEYQFDERDKSNLIKALELFEDKKCLTVNSACYGRKFSLSLSGFSICISTYSHILARTSIKNEIEIFPAEQPKKRETFYFSFDGMIFIQNRIGKLLPAQLSQISDACAVYGEFFTPIVRAYIAAARAKNSYVWEDLEKLVLTGRYSKACPAITANECLRRSNMNDVMHAHYKNADFVNWNKADPSVANLIMNAMKWVDEKGKQFLLSMKYMTKDEINACYNYSVYDKSPRNQIPDFLCALIMSMCPVDSYWKDAYTRERVDAYNVRSMIYDYISISRSCKKKIKLSFSSAKSVKALHDELATEYTLKRTPKVVVPKNTKFKELRKKLPANFEWIKTRKRLVEEGTYMHHCVATYATYINKDYCAIYSYLDEVTGRRFTLEYILSKGEYKLVQNHGIYDCDCPADIEERIHQSLQ